MISKRSTKILVFFFAFSVFTGCLFQWGGYQAGILQAQSADDPEIAQIKNKLETVKLTINFSEAPFADVIRFLSESVEINIIVTPEAMAKLDKTKVSLQLANLPLKNVLAIIADCHHLDYVLTDGVILIKTKGSMVSKPAAQKNREASISTG